jgi:hypothetical protein
MNPTQNENSKTGYGEEFLKNSSLYQEFLAERDEILKHKWIESEKAGHDIGFERALLNWIITQKPIWRAERKKNKSSHIQHVPYPKKPTPNEFSQNFL